MASSRWLPVLPTLGVCLVLVLLASQEFLAITPLDEAHCVDERVSRTAFNGKVVPALAAVLVASSGANVALWVRPALRAARSVVRRRAWECRCCFGGMMSRGVPDLEAELVQRECEKLRLQLALRVFGVLNCALVPVGLFMGLLLLTGRHRAVSSASNDKEWRALVIRDHGLPVWTLLSVCMATVSANPELLTSRFLDGLLGVLTCAWLWWTCSTSACNLCWLGARSLLIRVFQALLCSSKPLLAGLLLAAFVTDSAVRYRHSLANLGALSDSVLDLVHAAMIIGFCWTLRRIMLLEARALVEARRCGSANKLVHRLLDSMCDAVVLLDADFGVSQPSPKLAGLLLHRHLPTQSFTGLLHPDDRERFADRMADEAGHALMEEAPPALALHARLRDADGSYVPVELFCSCIPDANTGLLQYMVGVKEEGPRCEAPVEPPAENVAPTARQHPAILENASRCADSDCTSYASSSPDEAGEISAWVGAFDQDMRVLRHTLGFVALSGPSPMGAALTPWFDGCGPFVYSFQEKANEWAECGGAENFTLTRMAFSPPQLKPSGIHLQGTVTVTLFAAEGTEEEDVARLSFSDVQVKQKALARQWVGTPPVANNEGRLSARGTDSEGAAAPNGQFRHL